VLLVSAIVKSSSTGTRANANSVQLSIPPVSRVDGPPVPLWNCGVGLHVPRFVPLSLCEQWPGGWAFQRCDEAASAFNLDHFSPLFPRSCSLTTVCETERRLDRQRPLHPSCWRVICDGHHHGIQRLQDRWRSPLVRALTEELPILRYCAPPATAMLLQDLPPPPWLRTRQWHRSYCRAAGVHGIM
jgi:hypothetical protein